MMRRAFLQLLGMSGLTRGYVVQRPDQGSDPPPSLVPPSQAAGILRARTVIISGTGPNVGLFVYNGLPAKGHLVGAIVAPGVTSDPFGNTVGAVANFGKWSAAGVLQQHFGIDQNGDTFLANTSGLTVVHEHSADGSIWFYNTSGEGLGNLIASITPAAGTDLAGNVTQANITSYSPGTSTFAQLSAAQLVLSSTLGTTRITFPATLTLVDAISDIATPELTLTSPGTTAGPRSQILLVGENKSATKVAQVVVGVSSATPVTAALLEVQGSQALTGIATPASPPAGDTVMFSDTNGFERMLPGLAGDTDAYQIGEKILTNGGFTVNLTTPQTIMSTTVGIGTYVVEVWLVSSNVTAADAAGWAFTGPTAGTQLVDFESKTGGGVVGYAASSTYTTTFNGQGTGGNQGVLMRALVAFSAAGTLAFTGKQLVALNNVTVFGAWMRVRHVS